MKGRKPNVPLRLVPNDGRELGEGAGEEEAVPAMEPPAELCEIGAAEWRRVVPLLPYWSEKYAAYLECYCRAVARMRIAQREIDALANSGGRGLIVASPKGYPMQSPWLNIQNRAQEQVFKFGEALGLSPVGDVRLRGLGDAQGELPFPEGDAYDRYMAHAPGA